ETADAFRRPDRFELLLRATQAQSGADDSAYAQLAVALVTAAGVTLPPEQIAQLKGIAIAGAYRAARIERLQQLQSERRRSCRGQPRRPSSPPRVSAMTLKGRP